jgi:integrase
MARIKVRERKDGGVSYTVTWVIGGGRTGTAPSASETFTSEARAESFKGDVERSHNQWPEGWVKGEGYVDGRKLAVAPSTTAFGNVAADFFANQAKRARRGAIKPYTLYRDQRACVLHFDPSFAEMEFTEIEPEDIEDWVDTQIDMGAVSKSIRNRHGLLFAIMKYGQKNLRLRPDNPCEITELPQAENTRDIRFFRPDEWGLLRACLRSDVLLMCDTKLASAMRWGELAALRTEDCTVAADDRIHLRVTRAWSRRSPDDSTPINVAHGENASWMLGPPKNRRTRVIVIDGPVARDLIAHIASRSQREYLFTTRTGNPWRYPDFHSDRWRPARKEAEARGLSKKATPHMLRHTAVVWALADGVALHVVSGLLGHSDIRITWNTYGGFIDLHDPQMAQSMARTMMMAKNAIMPAPDRDDIDACKIRPGKRGESRARAG